MKILFEAFVKLPKWYGIIIVLAYSALVAEYMLTLNEQFMFRSIEITGVIKTFMQISFFVTILSGIVVWIVLCLLFHLTALLFNGKAVFGRFLIVSSYPYTLPALIIFLAIILLDGIDIVQTDDVMKALQDDSRFQLIVSLVNYSFIPYYLLVACIIHYLYNLKWLYALLSVAIPAVSIYAVTELFKLVM